MNHWKYSAWWGAPEGSVVTLGEGGTPLIRSTKIGPQLGLSQLWFKYEGANPSGSYKDRFAASAVSHLVKDGKSVWAPRAATPGLLSRLTVPAQECRAFSPSWRERRRANFARCWRMGRT